MNERNRLPVVGITALLLLLFSGCLEIKMNTRVNRDGSLVRTQTLTGDSAEVLNHHFPTVIDSSWSVRVEQGKTAEGQGGWLRIATKTYPNAEAMNRDTTTGLSLRVRGVFEKRFLWFFTEYSYKETYLCYSPFTTIPITEYVSQADLDRSYRHELGKEPYASAEDSLSMKEIGNRFMEWKTRNVFEAFFQELKSGIVELNDASLPVSRLEAQKEDLFEQTRDLYTSSGNVDTLLLITQQVLGSPAVRTVAIRHDAGFSSFRAKLEFVDEIGHSLQAGLTMPGVIIDSNAPTVEGNTATWKSVDTFAYIADFDIWVKSRAVNWWAVAVSGVVVLAVIILLVVGAVRRRPRPVS